MKKIIQKLFLSPIMKGIGATRAFFKSGKASAILRGKGFRESLKNISVFTAGSVLSAVVTRKILGNSEKNLDLTIAPGSNDTGDGYMILNNQYELIRNVRDNLTFLAEQSNSPMAMKSRNELIHNFVKLMAYNLHPEESHRILVYLESITSCALSGTFPQEAGTSDLLLRYSINQGENPITKEEADFRTLKVLNLALSGAPLN